MRYFLIDRVDELVPGKTARGIKNVTLSDEILHDHFPDFPVFPGALLIEGASQLAGYLLEATFLREGEPVRRALLAQVRSAKFYEPTGPGDTLTITVTVDAMLDAAAEVKVEVNVGETRVMRGMLTFVMKTIEIDSIHEQRRKLYTLWTRHLNPAPPIP